MKITISRQTTVDEEIEVDFPLYLESETEDGLSQTWYRIDADGKQTTVSEWCEQVGGLYKSDVEVAQLNLRTELVYRLGGNYTRLGGPEAHKPFEDAMARFMARLLKADMTASA